MIDELRRVWRWCGLNLHHLLLFLFLNQGEGEGGGERGPFHSTSVSKEGGYLTFHAERVELTREIIIIIIIHLSGMDGG